MAKKKCARANTESPALSPLVTPATASPAVSGRSRIALLALPVVAAFAVFLNTLSNDFVFDDNWIVSHNRMIRDLANTQ